MNCFSNKNSRILFSKGNLNNNINIKNKNKKFE